MNTTESATLFDLANAEDVRCYDALKAYFESMYFAN